MEEAKEQKRDFTGRDKLLLLVFIFGPIAALTNQLVNYTLISQSCADGSNWRLHLSAAISFLACLGCALLSRSVLASTGESSLREHRGRWMALSGFILSLAGAIVIIAMEIPNIVLRSCS
jgi:uncharacterized membrane protein HdeD (DUF308 family)